jgi:hypothetical protein
MKDRLVLVGFEWAGPQLRAWAFDNEGDILSSYQVRDEPVSGMPTGRGASGFI